MAAGCTDVEEKTEHLRRKEEYVERKGLRKESKNIKRTSIPKLKRPTRGRLFFLGKIGLRWNTKGKTFESFKNEKRKENWEGREVS